MRSPFKHTLSGVGSVKNLLVRNQPEEVESGEKSCRQVHVLWDGPLIVVTTEGRISSGKDGNPDIKIKSIFCVKHEIFIQCFFIFLGSLENFVDK